MKLMLWTVTGEVPALSAWNSRMATLPAHRNCQPIVDVRFDEDGAVAWLFGTEVRGNARVLDKRALGSPEQLRYALVVGDGKGSCRMPP
jgi:hypothetical protein